MPQINRIRVNNVKYNFGTQFYDDFLMRFSCKNTIYDLANGGGKSVLMLLLLQTVIPNCTLDDKQPVEKLFRTASGSTTIHSLVEWKLDACDVKNGFKYMTCGFCARKGEASSIEYFNYCIFYREFGDNDIKNLPLVNGNERITYNGLKAYLRDLERKDFGVEVKIFERKGDYQNFINDYGIYESHWEIIRGINKTEGHVRTYFESNYKTTRKVIEDLLVEEIIEKSYNNRIRGENSDDEMAKTLLDIKDKLLELAKRHEDIASYDRQIELIKSFISKNGGLLEIFSKKEAEKTALLSFLAGAKGQVAAHEKLTAALEEETENLKNSVLSEERLLALSDIAIEEAELKSLNEIIENHNENIKVLNCAYEEGKNRINLARIAADYEDYRENKHTLLQLKEYMENRYKDRTDITEEMKRLASKKHAIDEETLYKLDVDKLTADEAEVSENVLKLAKEISGLENEISRIDGCVTGFDSHINNLTGLIEEEMKKVTLLVSENAYEEAGRVKAHIFDLQTKLKNLLFEEQELAKKQEYCVRELANADAGLILMSENIDRYNKELEKAKKTEDELSGLFKVYGEHNINLLYEKISHIHDDMLARRENLNTRLIRLEEFASVIESGKPVENENVNMICEYIEGRYGDKAVSGAAYLRELPDEESIALLESLPFLPYSVVVKEEYESICMDKNILSMSLEGVVPVLSLEEINSSDHMLLLACKDLSFIYDEAGKQSGLKKVEEEKEAVNEELSKLSDRLLVVKKDYEKVGAVKVLSPPTRDELNNKLEDVKAEYVKYDARKEDLRRLKDSIKERVDEVAGRKKSTDEELDKTKREYDSLMIISNLNKEVEQVAESKREALASKEKLVREKKLKSDVYETKQKLLEEAKNKLEFARESISAIKKRWEAYAPYYDENADYGAQADIMAEDVDSKFDAMLSLAGEQFGDLSDKERLMENARVTMEKLEHSMEYRGVDLESALRMYEAGELKTLSHSEILSINSKQEELLGRIKQAEGELFSASAQMNRLEGSIAYARRNIEDRYGEIKEVSFDNPVEFSRQHKGELNRIKELLAVSDKKLKESNRIYTGLLLMEKDLERIVKTMGIDPDSINAGVAAAPENSGAQDALATQNLAKEYEEAGKRFDRILKDEERRKEQLAGERSLLVDNLTNIGAFELANEFRNSINIPGNSAEVNELNDALLDTIACIELERDRIGRGIRDMELIKENFENRCVQICCNIKAELERLPKLSKITLDDEVIPMLSLQIPYIKEELYKDRMSVYINETVAAAENFKTSEDKLKYIRGRLTWKRLFGVIVTDMNSIKLNLYKRERIKDQSRYLKYEEAVGSTGQSQGIYIQFLVAVINYIASINAGGKEAAVLGKTIFIDNPFGAAKDVYIWEPIFKMLKTNHVQLIVPARGATPAITGRFDVNYVLGQKMVDNKQQTVVVDYRSQVSEAEVDYERLSFTQESFDFL